MQKSYESRIRTRTRHGHRHTDTANNLKNIFNSV